MKRKFFLIFPLLSLIISIFNFINWNVFESLLWLFATILVSLIFFPLAMKAEEKDVPVYLVFAPVPIIPIFFTLFAYMDFSRIAFLTEPQAWIYSVITGIGTLGLLFLIIGPNTYDFK